MIVCYKRSFKLKKEWSKFEFKKKLKNNLKIAGFVVVLFSVKVTVILVNIMLDENSKERNNEKLK